MNFHHCSSIMQICNINALFQFCNNPTKVSRNKWFASDLLYLFTCSRDSLSLFALLFYLPPNGTEYTSLIGLKVTMGKHQKVQRLSLRKHPINKLHATYTWIYGSCSHGLILVPSLANCSATSKSMVAFKSQSTLSFSLSLFPYLTT